MQFNTKLLHGKTSKGYPNREILPPIAQTSAYRYDSMEELEEVFLHKRMGYAYSRIGNPGVNAFEQRVNELEGGAGAVCTASGMSAAASAILAAAKSGDEIIAGTGLYGGTIGLLHDLENLGIRVVYAPDFKKETLKRLINERTRLIFGEMIANPSLKVMDVPEAAEAAHEAGVPLFVDSTTVTPYVARPLSLGADVVIHSTSKYLNGGGNAIGGVIVDGAHFPWNFEKHTALAGFEKYRKMAFSVRLRTDIWENLGGCMAPMTAFLNYIGTDTLGLRMERILSNADRLARALSALPGLSVNYLTLPDHPCHALAERELNGYGGGIVSFRAGSRKRAFSIINSLKLPCIASNIGDVRTLVIHPASTLYLQASMEEQEAAGVFTDTVRISVGIEDIDDLIEDFTSAVKSAKE